MKKKILSVILILTMVTAFVIGIGGCKKEEEVQGEFKWLDEAYENDWLTKNDLENISYYYNAQHYDGDVNYGENFVPAEKNPAELDNATKENIKIAYCKKSKIEKDLYDYVRVLSYYGTYNNCITVQMSASCMVGGEPVFYPEYDLDGIKFYNYNFIGVYRI